jgi:hypothetical protein
MFHSILPFEIINTVVVTGWKTARLIYSCWSIVSQNLLEIKRLFVLAVRKNGQIKPLEAHI